MRFVSTTVQLVGTLVTAYGLLYAYGRASRLPARIKGWWARIRRQRRDITIEVQTIPSSAGAFPPDVRVEFNLDASATTDEKLAELERYVRELRCMFTEVNFAISRLEKAIQEAKQHADAAAAQALADAKAELKRFGEQLNDLQAVDLRIAAAGAFIMAVGYVVSYFGL